MEQGGRGSRVGRWPLVVKKVETTYRIARWIAIGGEDGFPERPHATVGRDCHDKLGRGRKSRGQQEEEERRRSSHDVKSSLFS